MIDTVMLRALASGLITFPERISELYKAIDFVEHRQKKTDLVQPEIVSHLCSSVVDDRQVVYVIDAQSNVWMIDGAHMRKVEVIRI